MNIIDREDGKVAAFVFKGMLAQGAIENSETGSRQGGLDFESVSTRVSLKDLDQGLVTDAMKMAPVYVGIAAFENSVRKLISDRLLEQMGADWWTTAASSEVQKRGERRQEDEAKIRWHGTRGLSPIYFTELGDLPSIIEKNWAHFEDILPDIAWVRHIVRTIERSRNVIMHGGQLSSDDIERVGMSIRDWIRQVGA